MGIYIPKMEMPQNCDQCPFVFYDADVNERTWCEAIKPYGIDVTDYLKERHEHCPLIELPPHGRLIDADALRVDYFTPSSTSNMPNYYYVSKAQIDNAPTIIESEE